MASRSVRASAPRLYPAGRAVSLFGICSPDLAGRKLTVEGRRIQAIAFGRLALLLGFVEGSEPVDNVAATEARIAEQAVDRAAANGIVLPVKFGTVYADPEALEAAVADSYPRWSRALTRLGAKREVAVHTYVGPHVPPGGEPYVLRVAGRASRSGRIPAMRGDETVVAHATALFKSCAAIATATRRVRPSPERGALWSATFLLSESDVTVLENVVERSTEAGAKCGVAAHFEGPRAPFSFV